MLCMQFGACAKLMYVSGCFMGLENISKTACTWDTELSHTMGMQPKQPKQPSRLDEAIIIIIIIGSWTTVGP